MSDKYALVIGNTEHTDPGLAQLKAPGKDAKEFWRVLSSPDICAFTDVVMLLNDDSYRVSEQIEIFFEKRKPDDLLLLYFSGHGVRDENGSLYLAVRNTNRSRLRSTAIKSDFIRSIMDECRSRRQVLILDCCNSGAFAQGTKAEVGGSVGTASAFRGTGYGRVVLTASDSTQFAWEGDRVIGETDNSLFTHFLIKGLEGEADRSGEGRITLDDLYDYAYEQIVTITPNQTPGKWSFRQQGEILLRESMRIEDVVPLPLPAELLEEIEDRRPYVREAAIQQLIKLMHSRNLRLAHSAREALERMAENDDSRALSRMAFQALEAMKQDAANLEQARAATAEAERLARQQAEEERLASIEAERLTREEAERLARLEAERKVKLAADLLAAQKAEADRLTKQKADEELTARAKAETERKAKEEAELLAKQQAEGERLARLESERKAKEELAAKTRAERERQAKEKAERFAAWRFEAASLVKLRAEAVVMFVSARVAALRAHIPASRAVIYGVVAATVLALAGFAIRAMIGPRATPASEAPIVQSTVPSMLTPEVQPSTSVPQTPTSDVLISVTGPKLEVGSIYSYIDGSVLIAVPAGEFSMGGGGTDNPEHKVTLSGYWMYSTEVSNQQYALCVSLGKCTAPDADDNPGFSDYKLANDPVTGVTFEQAANYCEFVHGRLPTEAEWEKAAQGPQGGQYPWGKSEPSCELLNFNQCLEGMASVVEYAGGKSYYGALNMAGNAFEWVADWYGAKSYSDSPAENPAGPANGTLRSVRSSSYESDANQVAVTIRNAADPQSHRADLGFRCVVDDPTYFAPFCKLPAMYAEATSLDTGSLESCPELSIKPVPICSNNIPYTNVTFVGPSESTIEPQDCIPSGNPNLFSCKTKGTLVSISAACQLNDIGDPSCLPGYSSQGNTCIADAGESHTAGNCLAGGYNSSQQCCNLPEGQTDTSTVLQVCPVGTFYAARANACLPQPVQELVTVTQEVSVAGSCSNPGGGGRAGGGGGAGGCQATQSEINNCNAGAPLYSWDSATCSCKGN